MIVAITGPTGVIGTELVNELVNQNHQVIAIANPGSNRIDNLAFDKNVRVVKCDISEYDNIVGKDHCDAFIHLAWGKTNVSQRDDVYSQVNNIKYCMDAIKLAKSWGAKIFVGAGSQAEYGPSSSILTSNTLEQPESGYGIAKYSSYMMGKLLCDTIGMTFCWARIVSVFGKNDMNHTLIKYLVTTILRGESPQLTPCDQIWDYMYAKDCARALISIVEKGRHGKKYLVASGQNKKLKDYVKEVRDLINPSVPINFGAKSYYPHQPMVLAADISELMNDTGFTTKYTFREGVSEVIEDVRQKMKSGGLL